jgi:hypothetical protein
VDSDANHTVRDIILGKGGRRQARDESQRNDNSTQGGADGRQGRTQTGQGQEPALRRWRQVRVDAGGPEMRAGTTTTARKGALNGQGTRAGIAGAATNNDGNLGELTATATCSQ